MTYSPQWNGYALHSGSTQTLNWKDYGGIEVKTKSLLRGGSGVVRNTLEGREITITGIIRSDTPTNATNLLDLLMKNLHVPGVGVLRISDDRYIDAYADTGSITATEGTDGTSVLWSCKFIATSPYWRGSALQTSTEVNSSSNVGPDTISYQGKAPSLPDWRFTALSGASYTDMSLIVRNSTTSEEFRLFQFSMAAGDVMEIDSSTGEIYFTGTPSSGAAVPKRVDGQFWELPNGNSDIYYEPTTTDSLLQMTCRYYERFHNVGEHDL